MELNKIWCMDNVQGMIDKVDDESIDLTVTSPPYDSARKYNGYSFDFEGVSKQLFRSTKIGGIVVWVVNDGTKNGSESGTSFKQALYFKEIGFNLHDTMIYLKENPVPLTHNRYEQYFEFMFIFSKGKPKTFNPIKIPCITANKEYNKKRNRVYDNNAMRHKNDRLVVTKKDKIKGNVWEYVVGSGDDRVLKGKHPAPFPDDLAQDHILSWSNPNDLVLDPFFGSGTTGKIAKKLGRKYIGFEISQEYCDIAEERCK